MFTDLTGRKRNHLTIKRSYMENLPCGIQKVREWGDSNPQTVLVSEHQEILIVCELFVFFHLASINLFLIWLSLILNRILSIVRNGKWCFSPSVSFEDTWHKMHWLVHLDIVMVDLHPMIWRFLEADFNLLVIGRCLLMLMIVYMTYKLYKMIWLGKAYTVMFIEP